jgi:hypothetical protein
MFWKRPHRRTTCSQKELRLVTELDLFLSGTSWTRPTPGHVSNLIVFIMHSFKAVFYQTGSQLLVPLLAWSVSLVMLIDGGEHACGESQRWGKLITLSIGPGRTGFHLIEWLHSLLGSLWASVFLGGTGPYHITECYLFTILENVCPMLTTRILFWLWFLQSPTCCLSQADTALRVYRKPVKIHSHRHTAPSWTGIIRTFPPHGPSISNLATYWPSDPYCRHSRYGSLDSNPYSQPTPPVSNNVQHAPGPSYHRVNIGPVCLPTPLPHPPPARQIHGVSPFGLTAVVTSPSTGLSLRRPTPVENTGSAVGDNDNRPWKKGHATRGHALTPGGPDTCVGENRDRLKLGLAGRGDLQRWVVVSAVPRPVPFVCREETLLDLH